MAVVLVVEITLVLVEAAVLVVIELTMHLNLQVDLVDQLKQRY